MIFSILMITAIFLIFFGIYKMYHADEKTATIAWLTSFMLAFIAGWLV